MGLTAIILTKNEEDVIEGAIKSVQFADEIIVVDSFSTDETQNIARKYNAIIFEDEFKDYASERNFAKEKAQNDWILYLDADERVTTALQKEIKEIIASVNQYPAFFVWRENYYLGKKWPTNDRIQRLFEKDKLISWQGVLHETPKIDGELGILKEHIIHLTHRDILSMLRKTVQWSEHEASLRFSADHPEMSGWRFIRVMLTEFLNYFVKQKGYKNGIEGLIESTFQSFSIFITYARLWEMQRKETLKQTYKKIDEKNSSQ